MSKDKEEYVEVTVKVPKRLMELLEDQEYFGWNKDDFFTVATHRSIDCELSEMDVTESECIEKKFGHEVNVWAFTVHKKLKP